MSTEKNKQYYISLSKRLSWILRHGALSKGIAISDDGYASWNKIKLLEEFTKFMDLTDDDLIYVVETNDKKRFAMKTVDDEIFVRANQGHSHNVATKIDQNKLLTALSKEDAIKLPMVVHGTTYDALQLIKTSGLKRMKRSHVHFAVNDKMTNDKNQSGIRSNCQVLIYLDIGLAIDDGLEFFISENDVVLSQGIGKEGCIPPKYFQRVVDRKSGNALM